MPSKPGKKRAQREREVAAELTQTLTSGATRAAFGPPATKADEELFFVDNAATTTTRKAKRREKRTAKVVGKSKVEEFLVDRLTQKIVAKRARATKEPPRAAAAAPAEDAVDDLWGDDDDAVAADAAKRAKKTRPPPRPARALGGVALPGQSYNPTLVDQQAVVQEGVDIETRKLDKEKETEDWWAKRHALRQPDFGDDDGQGGDSEDDEGDDECDAAEGDGRGVLRAPERITKSKRNKLKRKREAEVAVDRRRQFKAQREALDHARKIRKELDADQADQAAKRRSVAAAKERTAAAGPAPLEPRAVALSDDLTGALRSTKFVQNAGAVLLELQGGCKRAHEAKKNRKEPKKQRRLKYRGARYIPRYKNPFEAPG